VLAIDAATESIVVNRAWEWRLGFILLALSITLWMVAGVTALTDKRRAAAYVGALGTITFVGAAVTLGWWMSATKFSPH
jgi:hypothetical protein